MTIAETIPRLKQWLFARKRRMSQALRKLLEERNVLRLMLGEAGEPVFLDLKPGRLSDDEREKSAHRLWIVTEEIELLLAEQSDL